MDENKAFQDEIERMLYRNEHFHGVKANMDQVRRYYGLKEDLSRFSVLYPYARGMGGYDPNPRERNAMLWLDLRPAHLDAEEAADLCDLIGRSDGIVLVPVDGGVRISFEILNVWDDGMIDEAPDWDE